MKKLLIRVLLLIAGFQPLNANAEGSSPMNANSEGSTLIADFLLWHTSQQTASTWASVLKSSQRTLDVDATNVDFGWNKGFRGGVLHQLDCTQWDTGLYWTYFSAKANNEFSIGDQIVIPEFFSGFLSGNFFFGANLNWQLTMNMVDIEVGRKLDIDESFSIRPSIGIKGGTINQTINCQWNAGFFSSTERVKNNFTGGGPSLGIDGKWNICNGFSLFGDFSTAFMWGNWKISDTYSRPSALGGFVTPTTIITSMNNSKLGTVMYRYRMGLEWRCHEKLPLTLQLGYEMQFWPNQLRMPTFQQLPVHGDLTLQGGTCQLRIDF